MKEQGMRWLVNVKVPEEVFRQLGSKCALKGIDKRQLIRALVTLYAEGGAVERAADVWLKKFLVDGGKGNR